MIPHDDQVILFPHEDNCIQGIFHMPPWPNFPPWPCLDSQLPSNTELSLLCHNDESGRTLRLRTTYYKTSDIMLVYRQWYKTSDTGWWYTYPSEKYEFVSWDDDILIYICTK